MRIRNVKPEFYRSDDIDALTWEQRFLFIALFSYVDDNGVGRDRESDICADLFAGDFSADPAGTLARVQECLRALVKRELLVRYEVEGRRFLFLTGWDKHQYVKNPNRDRYPRPDKDFHKSSVHPGETNPMQSVDEGEPLLPVVGSRSYVVGSGKDKTSSNADALEVEFDRFWDLYPRKVGKGQARVAFRQALRKSSIDAIASALHAYVHATRATPKEKIRYPATWLNGEPWHDDPEAIAPVPITNGTRKQAATNVIISAAMQRAQERDAAREAADRKAIAQ